MTTLIFSNEELEDIMKIDKSLEEARLLIKSISETVENEVKVQKWEFLSILAATLGDNLWGNMLAGRGMKSKIPEREATKPELENVWVGVGTTKAGQNF